jgi:hypothetical protein
MHASQYDDLPAIHEVSNMATEDFWMRLYGLSADLQPVSSTAWNETAESLIVEFKKFPVTTREALRGHVGVMIDRLQQLYSRLN